MDRAFVLNAKINIKNYTPVFFTTMAKTEGYILRQNVYT